MKFLKVLIVLSLSMLLINLNSFSQEKNNPYKKGKNDTITVPLTNVDGELIPWVALPEVVVFDYRIYKSPEDRAKFNRLRYNVLKVLPYAKLARSRYEHLQRQLATTSNKREQRRMMKTFEKEIKDMFNKEIKNLTITQGAILIKLIDREIGNTSYELLKELKGNFSAFFYQSIARIFGHNLKNTYDPQQERDIEAIIRSTEYYRYKK